VSRAASIAPRAVAVTAPVVSPTRRQIDRRFPALGFTVATGAHPWFEVLLATREEVLLPAGAAERTPSTFYASRADGGLTPAADGVGRYVVPAAVLARFLAGPDRPRAIHYLAVSYPDATGTGGIPSRASGSSGFVYLASSLSSRPAGRSVVLSIRPSKTLEVLSPAEDALEGEDGRDVRFVNPQPAAGLARMLSVVDDRLAGEDGRDLVLPAIPRPLVPVDPSVVPVGPSIGGEPLSPISSPPPEPTAVPGPAVAVSMAEDWSDYEDGWEGWDRWGDSGRVAAKAAPGLDDEYTDVRWDAWDDRYGAEPAPLALEDQTTTVPAPGPAPAGGASPLTEVPGLLLDPAALRRIVEHALAGDGSTPYSMVNADGAFRGRHGRDHKAYQRFHLGLSFGIAEFNQDQGALGQLAKLMDERDASRLAALVAPVAPQVEPRTLVDELLAVTNAPGPSSEYTPGGRGARVQPVAGTDLWEEPWLSAFRESGRHPAFQAAQNQLAAELFLAPMLSVAAGFGLTSERALCLLLDRAVNLGVDGARRWVADTVGPVQSPAVRQQALAALGCDSIEAFQRGIAGLLVDGEFGPLTHAALTAALRRLGPSSPVPLPALPQMVDTMSIRAEHEPGSARFAKLASAAHLGDDPLNQ
jgi:hypothetical protein